MVKYKWTVTGLYTETVGDKENCVIVADYNVVGTEGSYRSTIAGSQTFVVDETVFIPYKDLTNDLVVDWIKNLVNIADIIDFIDTDIYTKENPPKKPIDTPLPWILK
jgi:hypothetical protein